MVIVERSGAVIEVFFEDLAELGWWWSSLVLWVAHLLLVIKEEDTVVGRENR